MFVAYFLKIALFLIVREILSVQFAAIFQTNAAAIRSLSPTENALESNRRDVGKEHLKTFRIIAEHIGPSSSPHKSERGGRLPKYDSVEFEGKNVETVEQVVTSSSQNDTTPPPEKKTRREVQTSSSVQHADTTLRSEDIKIRRHQVETSSDVQTYEGQEDDSRLYDEDSESQGLNHPSFRRRGDEDFEGIDDQYDGIGFMHDGGLKKKFNDAIRDILKKNRPGGRDLSTGEDSTAPDRRIDLNSVLMSEISSSASTVEIMTTSRNANQEESKPKRQSPDAVVNVTNATTLPTDANSSAIVENKVKKSLFPEISDNNTIVFDLDDPKYKNFSYVGKPGDNIVLRIDRQHSNSSLLDTPVSRNKKEDEKTPELPTNLQELEKKAELFEEKILNFNDNATSALNTSDAVSQDEGSVLKRTMPLVKLARDSKGRFKWALKDLAGPSKLVELPSQPDISNDVIYVVDKQKRKEMCDSLLLQLLKSNLFVVSLIFILIVAVVVLFLILIYNVGMRSARKHKYKKVRSQDYRSGKRPASSSRSLVDYMKSVFPTAESVKGVFCKPTLSSEEDEGVDSEEKKQSRYRSSQQGSLGIKRNVSSAKKDRMRSSGNMFGKGKTHSKDSLRGKERKQIASDRHHWLVDRRVPNDQEQKQIRPTNQLLPERPKGRRYVDKRLDILQKSQGKNYVQNVGPILSFQRYNRKHKKSSIDCACVQKETGPVMADKVKELISPKKPAEKVSKSNDKRKSSVDCVCVEEETRPERIAKAKELVSPKRSTEKVSKSIEKRRFSVMEWMRDKVLGTTSDPHASDQDESLGSPKQIRPEGSSDESDKTGLVQRIKDTVTPDSTDDSEAESKSKSLLQNIKDKIQPSTSDGSGATGKQKGILRTIQDKLYPSSADDSDGKTKSFLQTIQDKIYPSSADESDGRTKSKSLLQTIQDKLTLQKKDRQTTDDSEPDYVSKRTKLRRKGKKKKKKPSAKHLRKNLRSVVSEVEISSGSSPSPRSRPRELVSNLVATGECRKIDEMLTGSGWKRSVFYSHGLKTLDDNDGNGSLLGDDLPEVADDEEPGVGELNKNNSSLVLQEEIGKFINEAENNVKRFGHP